MLKLSKVIWHSVGTPIQVPENLREKWNGEMGCPVYDFKGGLIGYASEMPNQDSDAEHIKFIFVE